MQQAMSILILDNYDSFTYNIVHVLRELGVTPDVERNDVVDLDAVQKYDKIIISPGPGIPSEAGRLMKLIERYRQTKPILGVCLGHQALAESFGGKLVNLSQVWHGIADKIKIVDDDYIFDGLEREIVVGRYHSWAVSDENLPKEIIVTARDSEGTIMAFRHAELDIRGVQFHPESIMTECGKQLIQNWLNH
jgi:anthranilate synthase component 2